MRYMILAIMVMLFIITGCCASKPPTIITNKVMVPVPCKITIPSKPVMPLTDTGDIMDDIFVKSKKALAEINIRKGYEAELEAAVGSCQ